MKKNGPDTFGLLNEVYKKLHEKANRLESELVSGGFDCSWGWYNFHLSGEKPIRYYPAPVITIHGLGEVHLDINSLYFTAYYSREGFLSLDLEKLAEEHKFEVFDADGENEHDTGGDTGGYAGVIYSSAGKDYGNPLCVREKIFAHPAKRVAIYLSLPSYEDFGQLRETLAKFSLPEELM